MRPLPQGWKRVWVEERDATVLGLLRLALSALLLANGARLWLELVRNGYFGDFFHIPMVPESWLPTRTGYALVLAVQALAAVLSFFGAWRPREALLTASSLGLFLLACDRLQYHNNRYALLLLGFLLAFVPCDRSYLVTRSRPGSVPNLARLTRLGPTFARRLFQIQVSLVYAASATGKLLDSDWRGGQVLWVRFAHTSDYLASRGIALPTPVLLMLSAPLFASLAAKVAIATEVCA